MLEQLIGKELERYQMISLLGQSRSAALFKAFDPKIQRVIAIKVLDPELSRSEELRTEFLNGARTAIRWHHAGLVRFLDFGQADDLIFLAMEYLPGGSLKTLLERLRASAQWILPSEAVLVAIQICQALDFIHQRGLQHGNMRPGNILIRNEAREGLPYGIVLTDPELVHPELSKPEPSPYLAPEILQGQRSSRPGDIFAAAALLFELLTGNPPEQAPANGEQSPLSTQVESAPQHITSAGLETFPEALQDALQQAMEPDPDRRTPSVAALQNALQESLSEVSKHDMPPVGMTPTTLLEAYRSALDEAESGEPEATIEHPALDLQALSDSKSDLSGEKEFTGAKTIAEPSEDRTQDSIQILQHDHTVRFVHMKPEGLTIGRDPGNDIALNDPRVSRHHARIDYDGSQYQVRDLGSVNGTLLGNQRLIANSPQTWMPDQALRIGDTWFRLVLGKKAQPAQESKTEALVNLADGRALPVDQVQLSEKSGALGIYCENPKISLVPGKSTSLQVLLFNRGMDSDYFRITVSGIPPAWLVGLGQSIPMAPNSQEEVRLNFKPPRTPESRSGTYTALIQVSSQLDPGENARLQLDLSVAAFSQFRSELASTHLKAGETSRVQLVNEGNAPETFTLIWSDKDQKLVFQPADARLTLEPKQRGQSESQATLRQKPLFGSQQELAYSVHVSSSEGQMQSHQGQVASQALLPLWVPAALIPVCLVLFCAASFLVRGILSPGRSATQTALAEQSAIPQIVQLTIAAATETAASLAGANQSTLQAVTATAAWAIADDDRDSLTNGEELSLGTLPDKIDTDEDGLSDGEEVKTYKTNPLAADSDGDGLKDGEEVARGLNPLNQDTDGDGLPDASDPDPGHVPTPSPSATTKPSSTPTGTPQPTARIADLEINLTNNQTTQVPGDNISYVLVATNHGPSPVNGARVSDIFPASLGSVTWTCSATPGSNCEAPSGSGNISLALSLAVNGSASFSINSKVLPGATGTLQNSASLAPPGGVTDNNTANNQSSDSDLLTPQASLTLSITDGADHLAPGQADTYTIRVHNNGPSSVMGITVVSVFPDILTGVTWSCSATTGSACLSAGTQNGTINTQINLAAGGETVFTASGKVRSDATGTLSTSATISSPVNPEINNQTTADSTALVPSSDLQVLLISSTSVISNTDLTYTIEITNSGPSDASGITLVNALPAGFSFLSASPPAPACQSSESMVTCNFAALPSQGHQSVVVTLHTPATKTVQTLSAQVSSTTQDPQSGNNTSQVSIQVR